MPTEKPKSSWLFRTLMVIGILIVLSPFLKIGYYFVKAYTRGALGA